MFKEGNAVAVDAREARKLIQRGKSRLMARSKVPQLGYPVRARAVQCKWPCQVRTQMVSSLSCFQSVRGERCKSIRRLVGFLSGALDALASPPERWKRRGYEVVGGTWGVGVGC